jgi:hypothetical protein
MMRANAARTPGRIAAGSPHDECREGRRVLRHRDVDLRRRFLIDAVQLDVSDDADDLLPRRILLRPSLLESPADGVLAVQKAPHEFLVDDGDLRRGRRIGRLDESTGAHRHAKNVGQSGRGR